jgi:hypothetical protein
MDFAPAIRPQLLAAVDELDDGERGIASIWRELGRRARAAGLCQPSYESVRRLVHARREQATLTYSELKRAAILVAEFLWNARNRKELLLDAYDGADIERRRERYQRRPRGSPTPRAGA